MTHLQSGETFPHCAILSPGCDVAAVFLSLSLTYGTSLDVATSMFPPRTLFIRQKRHKPKVDLNESRNEADVTKGPYGSTPFQASAGACKSIARPLPTFFTSFQCQAAAEEQIISSSSVK